jgi:hypothetical protein
MFELGRVGPEVMKHVRRRRKKPDPCTVKCVRGSICARDDGKKSGNSIRISYRVSVTAKVDGKLYRANEVRTILLKPDAVAKRLIRFYGRSN